MHNFTYEFRFVIDNFDDITFLGRSDNASTEFLTEYFHLFSTSFGCVGNIRYASVLYRSVLEELLVRTEESSILIVRGYQLMTMILRSQDLHFV